MDTNTDIAKTILKQLGGNRVRAMTGAKTFVAIEKGLMFTFPQTGAKPNHVRIELNGNDEYDVSFWKIRGSKAAMMKKLAGVPVENLVSTFEDETGLYLSL